MTPATKPYSTHGTCISNYTSTNQMCFNQRFKSLAIHVHEMKKEIDAFISVKCTYQYVYQANYLKGADIH